MWHTALGRLVNCLVCVSICCRKPTSLCLWPCDPERFLARVCRSGLNRRSTRWCWFVSAPRWKPVLARSLLSSRSIPESVESRIAPRSLAVRRTRRLDRWRSSPGRCGSPVHIKQVYGWWQVYKTTSNMPKTAHQVLNLPFWLGLELNAIEEWVSKNRIKWRSTSLEVHNHCSVTTGIPLLFL